MNISELTLKLIILLLPGIISANIYGKLTFRSKPKSNFMFILTSIVFGVASYLSLQVFVSIPVLFKNTLYGQRLNYDVLNTFKDLNGTNAIPYLEVIWGTLLGIAIAFIAAGIDHKKYINRLGNLLNLTSKYGDENLFMKFLNSPEIDYVYVRDIANKLTYTGNIDSYSETEEFKEIVLGNVEVYNYPESELLYSIDRIYLCLPSNSVIIELANNKNNGTEA